MLTSSPRRPPARTPRRSSLRALAVFLAAALALPLAGCLPSRIVVDLAPTVGEFEATTVLADPAADPAGPAVALIDVSGVISHVSPPGVVPTPSTVDRVVSRLRAAADDPDVRAVVLRVNSPGGTVAASDSLYREIRAHQRTTGHPVVVSMADLATSGGYYVSLAADELIAQPSTITGSVGVIVQTFNLSAAMQRVGVAGEAVVSHPNKDVANPFEPRDPDHYAILQTIVDDFYDQFRERLRADRPALTGSARFDELTDGRVLTGRAAAEAGLVDSLGDLRDAFDAAKRRAGLDAARLVRFHAPGAPPSSLYSASAAAAALPGPAAETASPAADAARALLDRAGPASQPDPGFYYLWRPPGSLLP